MNKLFIALLATSSLFLNSQVNAENDIPYTLNFSQALELAMSHDQDLQAAEYAYQSALATRGLSKSALLPQLNFSAFTRQTEQETENSSSTLIPDGKIDFGTDGYNLSLSQTIYNHSLYKNCSKLI